MPLHWHVNAGPVAYSRPMRKKRRKSGPLTSVMTWFIVKPLEWTVKGTIALFGAGARSARRKVQVDPTRVAVAYKGAFSPPATEPGWYWGSMGWLYWNGQTWYDLDGRTVF